jgi:hypothetical protein
MAEAPDRLVVLVLQRCARQGSVVLTLTEIGVALGAPLPPDATAPYFWRLSPLAQHLHAAGITALSVRDGRAVLFLGPSS